MTSVTGDGRMVGLVHMEADLLAPLDALVDGGRVVVTDFTSLVDTWKSDYGAAACIHRE